MSQENEQSAPRVTHLNSSLVAWDEAQERYSPASLAPLLEDVNGVPRWRWWLECQDARNLLRWAASRVDRRVLVMAACDCAETALVHVPQGEKRPRVAIETARAWCRGEASLEEVRDAAEAAYVAVAHAHACNCAGYAARAAYAASAAAYAAYAASAAAYAAYAVAVYASAAANPECADVKTSLAAVADVVRSRIAWEDLVDDTHLH